MSICDEMDLGGRGCVRGMVVTETSGNIGPSVRRPGFGRGAQGWSNKLVAGAEKVRTLAFRAEGFEEAELDLMEVYNVQP